MSSERGSAKCWRKLSNRELHNLPSSSYFIKRLKEESRDRRIVLYAWERYAYGVLAVKSERKRTLERAKCNWEYNTKMDFKMVGCQTVN